MFSRLKPSPSMIVALLALFVAMGGSAYAVSRINGAKLKNRSVPAKKIKRHALTGEEIDLSKLGTVPSANSANTAANALALGGLGPGAYVSALDMRYSTPADGCTTASPNGDGFCIVFCPPGEFALSGGASGASSHAVLRSLIPISSLGPVTAGHPPTGWEAVVQNLDAMTSGPTVWVQCAKVGSASATEQPASGGFG